VIVMALQQSLVGECLFGVMCEDEIPCHEEGLL
jgi:hypothetical protein